MQEILNALGALGNAAGWTVAVAVLSLGVYGFWKGWWVPGFIYRREVARGDVAERSVEGVKEIAEQSTTSTQLAVDLGIAIAKQLSKLQDAARDTTRESD